MISSPYSTERKFDLRNDPPATGAIGDIALQQTREIVDDAVTSIQRAEGHGVIGITDRQPAAPMTRPIENDQNLATATRPKGVQQQLDDQMAGHEYQRASLERRQLHALDAG